MTAAKKRPYSNEAADKQEDLRAAKALAEQLRDRLQKSIIDNPKAARKAALLLELWMNKSKKLKR